MITYIFNEIFTVYRNIYDMFHVLNELKLILQAKI